MDFSELRRLVTMAQVLELLDWRPTSRRGGQLRGPCPLHKSTGERSRIFSVNLEKHAFQCFKCQEKGNQLDLYAKATGLSLYEAAWDLCRRTGVTPPIRS